MRCVLYLCPAIEWAFRVYVHIHFVEVSCQHYPRVKLTAIRPVVVGIWTSKAAVACLVQVNRERFAERTGKPMDFSVFQMQTFLKASNFRWDYCCVAAELETAAQPGNSANARINHKHGQSTVSGNPHNDLEAQAAAGFGS